MYTYKRAVGISLLNPKGEELLDISAVPTSQLFTLYSNLIVVVTDAYGAQDVAIDLQTYQSELSLYQGTIQQWLNTKATTPLKTSNTLPGTEYRFATMHDIREEWFTPLPGDALQGDDRQASMDKEWAPDIRIVKTDNSDVDFDALVTRGLFFINGHATRAVKGTRCAYLLNAGKHFRVYDNMHIGYMNLNTVSKLKTYALSAANIKFDSFETYNFLHYKSPVSLKGKTVWMSIGGRLYFNDVIQVKGNKGITIRTEKVDWFTRTFDSKDLIDLSSVIDKDRQVVGADFFSTETFFKALLTDPSSFLIVLDNPHLYIEVKPLTAYRYPYTYHTEETRRIPLLTGGLLPKYFTRRIINRRLLDISIGVQRRYLNDTTGVKNEGNLFHGYTNRFKPNELFKGFHLYIRGLIQED